MNYVQSGLMTVVALTGAANMSAQSATLVPLLPSAGPGVATGPGTVTIIATPGQIVNGKGTVTASLPGSLPIIPCPKSAGYSQCVGPATVTIKHTLTGFDDYLIYIDQDGLTPQTVGNSTIQQCDDRDYNNKFTPRTSFDCRFDWIPYFTGSFATFSVEIKVHIVMTDKYGGDFENRARIALEIVNAVRQEIGPKLPLFLRISATDWTEGGWTIDDSVELARRVKALGVDLIDVSSGGKLKESNT